MTAQNVHVTIIRKVDGARVFNTIAALVEARVHPRKGPIVFVALDATWCCDFPLSEYRIAIAGPDDHGPSRLDAYCDEAHRQGVAVAEATATWVADGNTKTEAITYLLDLMADGDPSVDDYLPAYPNLSGEWADGPTPMSLFEDITGQSHADAEAEAGLAYETLVGTVIDAIAEAWETGVSETFQTACEAELRKWVPEYTNPTL